MSKDLNQLEYQFHYNSWKKKVNLSLLFVSNPVWFLSLALQIKKMMVDVVMLNYKKGGEERVIAY
jgi:hypothetical protein